MKQSIKIVNPKAASQSAASEAWIQPNVFCWFKQEEKKDASEEQIVYRRAQIQYVDQQKLTVQLLLEGSGETVKAGFQSLVQANNEQ